MDLTSNLLSEIPTTMLPKEITSVQLIEGGFNNHNVLMNGNYLIKKYLQQDESNDPIYSRFIREKEALTLLKHDPFTPKLLKYYNKPPKFYIARNWIEGTPISIKQVHSHVNEFIKGILSFQKANKATSGDFYYFDVISRYLRQYSQILANDYPKTIEIHHLPNYHKVDQYYQKQLCRLQSFNQIEQVARLHGDLVLSNIIKRTNKDKLMFIDWEYSTLGDPLIDLSYFLTQNHLPKNTQNLIIECYQTLTGFELNINKLKVYNNMMKLMSALWYSIHAFKLKYKYHNHLKSISSVSESMNLAINNFKSLNLITE